MNIKEKEYIIKPIIKEKYYTSDKSYNSISMYKDICLNYFGNNVINNISTQNEIAHRRFIIEQIVRDRITFIIKQSYYKSLNSLKINTMSFKIDINNFINFISEKYKYFIDVNSYIPGGIYDSKITLIDYVVAISYELNSYILSYIEIFNIDNIVYNNNINIVYNVSTLFRKYLLEGILKFIDEFYITLYKSGNLECECE